VTTDLELSASWIVRHYEERPEIEQDYEQMKSGGWQLQKLSSTRYSEIVFYQWSAKKLEFGILTYESVS